MITERDILELVTERKNVTDGMATFATVAIKLMEAQIAIMTHLSGIEVTAADRIERDPLNNRWRVKSD